MMHRKLEQAFYLGHVSMGTYAMNIEELLCFNKKGTDGPVMRPEDFREVYPQCAAVFSGTNFYYGLNKNNKETLAGTGTPLNPTHRSFFDDILADLLGGEADRKTIILGLEPPQQSAPYLFVQANLDLVRRLAASLGQYQATALEAGKQMRIVIRYASEMNDRKLNSPPTVGNQYAGDPASYKASFRTVREIFRTEAPHIEFAFSPAIRRDLAEAGLSLYWPGDDVVDVISCTWYVGADKDFKVAAAFFIAYFLHREGKAKPFGIDELGGCETIVKDAKPFGSANDAMLQRMLAVVEGLKDEGIRFSYTTLFLESKWGDTATMEWL